jgi:hypothetical protein
LISFAKTHVPRKYADPIERGHGLQTTSAVQAVTQWRTEQATLIVLSGEPGTGKSMAAAAVLHRWWRETAPVNPWGKLQPHDGRLWIAAVHLARLQPWSEDVQALEVPGMLVLDDLGEEEGTPKAIAMVSDLITTRFGEDKATVITTNLDGSTFIGRYGTRITDRLRECGLDDRGKAKWWVKCSGESLRGRVQPEAPTVANEAPTIVLDTGESPSPSIGQMADEWLARQSKGNDE